MLKKFLPFALAACLVPTPLISFCVASTKETPKLEDEGKKSGEKIEWVTWSDDIFERAKRENKFVILDLEAIWCHWCHVMDKITYSEPEVISLINSKFIAVRVDQDSRPDLSNRYEDYGWPATIFFGSDGTELVKRSGYIPPTPMSNLLKAIIADPTPGPSAKAEYGKDVTKFSESANIKPLVKRQMERMYIQSYDFKYGSWGFVHKYLEWDSVELAMTKARAGNKQAERMAKQTLDAQLNLLDPAWGGVYQYSTGGKWDEPHFEKIMSMQAENLRIYSLAYMIWPEERYLNAAKEIHRFLKTFLTSPEGAFYTSQDADLVKGEHSAEYFNLSDTERRKLGIPKVDTNVYARENGWVINALCNLYAATGDQQYLDDAVKAAKWITAHRSVPGGGFRHDEVDRGGPYLGDNIAMARALLSLYMVTGDRNWLQQTEQLNSYINANFAYKNGEYPGFATASLKTLPLPKPQKDENIAMVRLNNLLFHYTGKEDYKKLAQSAMRYLATPEVAKKRPVAGILLADLEISSDPAHITVVGAKDDPKAKDLFLAAIAYPSGFKRVEWLDRKEGELPNADIEYPEVKSAAAFACANQRCSLPAFSPQEVKLRVEKLRVKTGPAQ